MNNNYSDEKDKILRTGELLKLNAERAYQAQVVEDINNLDVPEEVKDKLLNHIANSGDSTSTQKSEGEMLRTPNFGRKSLNEIKEVLTGMSLYLGMEIPNWPPDNIAELSKKLEDNI